MKNTNLALSKNYSFIENKLVELLHEGLSLHLQSNFLAAQSIYEQVLKVQPNNFDGNKLLGALLVQTEKYSEAVSYLSKAIKINPKIAACYNNRGFAFKQLERTEESLEDYAKAIKLNENYAEAYYNRGATLEASLLFDQAISDYVKAIEIKPDYVDSYNNLGNVLKELKRFDEALLCYDAAIKINPAVAEIYCNRGTALKELGRLDEALLDYEKAINHKLDFAQAYYNRGNALKELQRFNDAMSDYNKAIEIKPDYAESYNNLGNVLKELKRFDEAIFHYEKAISIKSDYAESYSNCGLVLQQIKRLDDALLYCKKAVLIKPQDADLHINYGNALQENRQFDEALFSYEKALVLRPEYPEAHWNLSLHNLLVGNLNAGWKGYEWRWKCKKMLKNIPVRNFSQPLWLGAQSPKDKTILLYAEQGLGDTIQFCRYVPLVAQLGAKIVLEIQAPLVKLLSHSEGVGQVFTQGDQLPEFDFQCPLLSLPLVFRTEIDSIPQAVHIHLDEMKLKYWQAQLGTRKTMRVGIVWSGNPSHKNDHNRSMALSDLIPFLPSECEIFSLQKEIRDHDREVLTKNPKIRHFGNVLQDFTDTAVLCQLMDLIISVDTSIVHLAGSIGKRTWVLVPYDPDWRWLLERSDSPWYPSAELFRQEEHGNWNSPLRKIKTRLEEMLEFF